MGEMMEDKKPVERKQASSPEEEAAYEAKMEREKQKEVDRQLAEAEAAKQRAQEELEQAQAEAEAAKLKANEVTYYDVNGQHTVQREAPFKMRMYGAKQTITVDYAEKSCCRKEPPCEGPGEENSRSGTCTKGKANQCCSGKCYVTRLGIGHCG